MCVYMCKSETKWDLSVLTDQQQQIINPWNRLEGIKIFELLLLSRKLKIKSVTNKPICLHFALLLREIQGIYLEHNLVIISMTASNQ